MMCSGPKITNKKRFKQHPRLTATPTSSGTSTTDQADDVQGVSVHWLCTGLVDEIRSFGLDEKCASIHDIECLEGPSSKGVIRKKGAHVMSPVDGRLGASYVHCLKGKDRVGKANYMLSYTWSYKFGDIISTLQEFCKTNNLNPKRTYIWIDCLCINQHRVVEAKRMGGTGLMNFEKEFSTLLQRIGNMLAMMAPWDGPFYLKRIWCIFEIYTAHELGCNVEIVMPPNEKKALERDLFGQGELVTLDVLYKALGQTKVQNAQASVEKDRTTILGMIEKQVGCDALNNVVNELLRSWVRGVIDQIIKSRMEEQQETDCGSDKTQLARLLNKVGYYLLHNGELDESLGWYDKCLSLCSEQQKSLDKKISRKEYRLMTADCYINIGEVLRLKGEYDKALTMLRKSFTIHKSIYGTEHVETALSYNQIGYVLADKGDFGGALVELRRALAIRESVLGTDHPTTANSYSNIANVLNDMGDNDAALIEHYKALAIRESALGREHPDTAASYGSIGSVLGLMGDYDDALSNLRKALAIHESVFGKEHPDTAISYNNVGIMLSALGEHGKALVEYRKALNVYESVFGSNNSTTASSYNNIGEALHEIGDSKGALVELRKALDVYISVFGEDHPDTAVSYNSVGDVLSDCGDFNGSLVAYRKAHSIREEVFGKDHPETEESFDNIQRVLRLQERTR